MCKKCHDCHHCHARKSENHLVMGCGDAPMPPRDALIVQSQSATEQSSPSFIVSMSNANSTISVAATLPWEPIPNVCQDTAVKQDVSHLYATGKSLEPRPVVNYIWLYRWVRGDG
jgi:hypothetical protein